MDFDLPEDLEAGLKAQVDLGRFPSVEAAIIEAVRRLVGADHWWERLPGPLAGPLKEHVDMLIEAEQSALRRRREMPDADPVIGSMSEFADEMAEITEEAMRRRREEASWMRQELRRPIPDE